MVRKVSALKLIIEITFNIAILQLLVFSPPSHLDVLVTEVQYLLKITIYIKKLDLMYLTEWQKIKVHLKSLVSILD